MAGRRLLDQARLKMIELNVYFFCWLGSLLDPIQRIIPDRPLAISLESLVNARIGLEDFKGGRTPARAFPRTAGIANELLAAINDIVPPVGTHIPNPASPIQKWQVDRLRTLCNGIFVMLSDESQRSYILKVQDQRYLSSYSLVEKIEDCFPKECWELIEKPAKREFEECGKCLSLERYTASGFHALRGVECVIRQYLVKLTGDLPKKRDWGFYIEKLEKSGADAKLVAILNNIKTLDRNPLMHPEDWLNIDDAVGIFTTAQAAIVRLVEGIKKRQT